MPYYAGDRGRPFGHSSRPRSGSPGHPRPPAAAGRRRRRPGPSLDLPGPGQRGCRTDRRLLAVSGSIVADQGESPYLRYLLKPLVRRTFLRHVCADFHGAEDEIHASGLDWTIFRPPSLTSKPASGTYRTATDRNLPRCFSISRTDLAACMLTLLDDPATAHKHVCIAD
jgi:hypothetical protein